MLLRYLRYRFSRRLPLAWLMLKRQPMRMFTALLGVAFAGILILMQLGFQQALFTSSVAFIRKLDADLVLINRQSVSLINLAEFPEERLAAIKANPAVLETAPVRWRYAQWRFQGKKNSMLVIAVGVNPAKSVFNDNQIQKAQSQITADGRILFDRLSRREFGPVVQQFLDGQDVFAYVNDFRLRVAGLIGLGPSFGYDGSFIANISTVNEISSATPTAIELGVIRLAKGANLSRTIQELQALLPEDVVLLTRKQFEDSEMTFWNTSKPIGFVFAFCTVMGLAVGAMMVYQVLHTDVSFHLPSYAVLLSIGYKRTHLEAVVFAEGLMLSLLGFPLGWLISEGLYALTRSFTGLPMQVSPSILVYTFLLILSMCSASALLAMLKLQDADPANLFG